MRQLLTNLVESPSKYHRCGVPLASRLASVVASVFFIIVMTALVAPPAAAQTGFGAHVGADLGRANTFAGVDARIGRGNIQFAPSFEASFEDGFNRWQGNLDLLLRNEIRETRYTPYLGAGLGILQSPGDNVGLGANMIGGISLSLGPVAPFIQTRLTVADNTGFSFMAGFIVMRPRVNP